MELRTWNSELSSNLVAWTLRLARAMPATPDYQNRAFKFACDIVHLYRRLEPRCPSVLARQLLRAATSIGANLEEAKAAQSRRDLLAKFSIALKEARETWYWLRLLAATGLASAEILAAPTNEANQLVAILTTSVARLRRTQA